VVADQWWAIANTAMKFGILLNRDNLLTSLDAVSFPRRIPGPEELASHGLSWYFLFYLDGSDIILSQSDTQTLRRDSIFVF
jgi:hypothetical protein